MEFEKQIESSVWAGIVGDALGLPVENSTRGQLALCAVKNMLGFGRFDQPKGTWSDDSAMMLCTMESLTKGYDIEDIGQTFCSWIFESHWTATGYVFDAGITTLSALESIKHDNRSARVSGGESEDDNGNGSLMRVLPAAIYFSADETATLLARVHEISAITHAHPRSKIGCGIYALVVRHLLHGLGKEDAYRAAVKDALEYYSNHPDFDEELKHFMRILSYQVAALPEEEINTSGYVVHTLEAALWSFLNHGNTRDILLAAVNLGLDTDTTGTAAGGLAGLYHGLDSIPDDWLASIARRQEITRLLVQFCAAVTTRRGKVGS